MRQSNKQSTGLDRIVCAFRIKIEEEKQKYESEIEDLAKEREFHIKQSGELKVELSLCEDRFENVKLQLLETNHKLKEGKRLCSLQYFCNCRG